MVHGGRRDIRLNWIARTRHGRGWWRGLIREGEPLCVGFALGLERRAEEGWRATIPVVATDGEGVNGNHETGQDGKDGG